MSELLLSTCNVQKLGVGGLEQSHADRDKDAHHPENDSAREVRPKGVRPNTNSSIDMKSSYSSKQ
jgi:hypothetical protein